MKKLLVLVLALAMCAFSVSAIAEEGDYLSQIIARGTLIIGTEGNWSPWTYHDEVTGELMGLDIEIGKLIAEGLGVKAEFREAEWSALLAGIKSDDSAAGSRFDIICNGVGYTEARAESYNFSTPYVYTNKVLVVRGDNETIKSIEDLKGRKTANSPSSTYAAIAEEQGATVKYVDTLGETIEEIMYGRVDATINAQVSIADYLREHPEANIKVVQVLAGDPVAYPVQKEGTESLIAAINEILENARQDGTLAAISIKYFGVDMTTAE